MCEDLSPNQVVARLHLSAGLGTKGSVLLFLIVVASRNAARFARVTSECLQHNKQTWKSPSLDSVVPFFYIIVYGTVLFLFLNQADGSSLLKGFTVIQHCLSAGISQLPGSCLGFLLGLD